MVSVMQFMVLYQLADQMSVNNMFFLDNSNYSNDQVSLHSGGILLSNYLDLSLAPPCLTLPYLAMSFVAACSKASHAFMCSA